MKKVLITLALLAIIFNYAYATSQCVIEIHNLSTKNTIYYWVYWVDHPYAEIIGPTNIMGGELEPDKTVTSEWLYPPGEYFIEWRDKNGGSSNYEEFVINGGAVKVIIGVSEEVGSYMFLELFEA